MVSSYYLLVIPFFLMEEVAARMRNVSFQRYNMSIICSGTVTALALNSRMLRWSPTAFMVRHFTPLCRPSGHLCLCLWPESEKEVGHRSHYSLSLGFSGSSHHISSMRTWWHDKIFLSIWCLYGKHMDLSQSYGRHSWRLALDVMCMLTYGLMLQGMFIPW